MEFLNPLNTAYSIPSTIFMIFLGVIFSYLVWKIILKLRIKIDKKFVISTFPWVVLTSFFRVLRDIGLIKSKLFVSPWLYIFMSIVGISTVSFLYIKRKKDYWKISLTLALIPLTISFFVIFSFLRNVLFIYYFISWYFPWLFFLYALLKYKKIKFFDFLALTSQMYDANVSFIAMNFFGYVSKHVLPTFFIDIFSPYSFILIKLLVVVLALVFINKFVDSKNFRNYVKILIAYIAILTATRDFLNVLCF